MNFVIGILIVGVCLIGGYTAMGGNVYVLWQPWEYVIILGGAVGAYIIGNSKEVLKDTAVAVGGLFKGKPHTEKQYVELLSMLFSVLRQARSSKGLNALEKDFDNPKDSDFFKKFPSVYKNEKALRFACDYLRLIQLGTRNPHELENLMDQEIDTLLYETLKTPKALQNMADALPALGIIAAIMGIVKAMGAINAEPEVLGSMIGGALVGTFSGILFSYCMVGPVAAAVKVRREAEINYFSCIKAGLIAHLCDYQPQISVEYARKVLTTDVRPTFEEVEKATMAIMT